MNWFQDSSVLYHERLEHLRSGSRKRRTWRKKRRIANPWIYSEPRKLSELPVAYWKIHLAVHPAEIVKMFELVESVLLPGDIAFKMPDSLDNFLSLNDAITPQTQLGKTITIYPRGESELGALVEAINETWGQGRGPKIASDLYEKSDRAIGIRYGEFHDGTMRIDACGRPITFVPSESGVLVEDKRSRQGEQLNGAYTATVAGRTWNALSLGSQDEIAVFSERYSVERRFGAWYKEILLVRNESGTQEIIKRVHKGACSDRSGRTVEERLSHEFTLVSDLYDDGYFEGRAPAIEEHELFAYLRLPFLAGSPLAQLQREFLPTIMWKLPEAIAKLHTLGWVHRDIKPTNAVYDEKSRQLRLIDFELADAVGSLNYAEAGTDGFRPPEDRARSPLATSVDVYAFGATLISLILRANPGAQRLSRRLLRTLFAANRYAPLSPIVTKCLSRNPVRRPRLDVVISELQRLKACVSPAPSWDEKLRKSAYEAVRSACLATRSFRIADSHGFSWRHSLPDTPTKDISLNTGAAGVVLGLMLVKRNLGWNEFDEDIEGGLASLEKLDPEDTPPGLFVGTAGVALTLMMGWRLLGHERLKTKALALLSLAAREASDPDLFFGSAGVVVAATLCARLSCDLVPGLIVEKLVKQLVADARSHRGIVCWVPSGKLVGSKVPKTSVSHGSAGISLAINAWGNLFNRSRETELGAHGLLSLYKGARTENGECLTQYVLNNNKGTENWIWCRGVSGYLWALLRSTLIPSGDAAAEAFEWAKHAFLTAGVYGSPTLCHGLAGALDLTLDLMVGGCRESMLKEKASWTAKALLEFANVRVSGRRTWASEHWRRVVPGFWIGITGNAYALSRWLAFMEQRGSWEEMFLMNSTTNAGADRSSLPLTIH